MSLGIGLDRSLKVSPQQPQLWLGPLRGADLSSLSPLERGWGEGLPEGQRQRYWYSRAALRQQLAAVLGLGPVQVPLHSPPGCPPRLDQGLGWISLSHSGEGLLIGYSRQPIGVDLEPAGRPLDAAGLLRRFYPVAEQARLQGLAGEDLRQAVLTSWVLKEAAIKWRQRSLAAELSQWCYDDSSGRLHHLGDGVQPDCRSAVHAGWRWAAVGAGCAEPSLHSASALR
ncbi:4'-phosphopantetheinyl transferase family protein [Cyanobium sp. Alchichica 3B3-8F6]|uniref:4'-phosphopantetheinyl transferase family protein n=1 Tax=unclassified Cyanobium TaxID=2627006 RepID=UPI0020CB74DE|nr:4'-phosphopantetheinyl transferase superfamily protein [Cyanobium sp. Alchichica 3B3-8F6]MCP9882885.1 4'-phosphopantetheinyl transferase superfamily protein [Cyanobium sp. Alchichica 3B3-8F6]MCP9943390.1 4'-phosphopantetheinyl transferase superfamily protein [Cyanobium sp. ATX 6E8]